MIIDACIVYNELDLFELRMNELHDVVDHFVVVESRGSIGSTNRKPLNFESFVRDNPRITYVTLDDLIPRYTDSAAGWQREKFQRDAMMWGVKLASKSLDDVVIASDADEIPRPSAIIETIPKLTRGLHRFNLDLFYYNVNCYLGGWPWGTTIGTVNQYQEVGGVHAARGNNYHDDNRVVDNAGWHFSYFGGLDRIKAKVENFSHSADSFCKEFLTRSDEDATVDIKNRADIYRTRGLNQFEHRASDDARLPQTFLNNIERYKHFTEEGMWSRAEIAEKS